MENLTGIQAACSNPVAQGAAVLKHGSLFTGIGGFDLAASWMGWENVFQCEKNEWCRRVLAKNFQNTKRYIDIKDFNANEYRGSIDIISGGFPCQPFSKAGKQRGKQDDRYLFPQMLRVIREVDPPFIIGENVYGIAKTALQEIKTSLEDLGYITIAFDIPASAGGALHRRSRIWIVGIKKDTFDTNTNGIGSYRKEMHQQGNAEFQYQQIGEFGSVVSESIRKGIDSRIFGNINGLSDRVDRIKGLGNAIVPQVAYEIFKCVGLLAAAP